MYIRRAAVLLPYTIGPLEEPPSLHLLSAESLTGETSTYQDARLAKRHF
jgi:hypothetical protein